jgi:hypothetical protein
MVSSEGDAIVLPVPDRVASLVEILEDLDGWTADFRRLNIIGVEPSFR